MFALQLIVFDSVRFRFCRRKHRADVLQLLLVSLVVSLQFHGILRAHNLDISIRVRNCAPVSIEKAFQLALLSKELLVACQILEVRRIVLFAQAVAIGGERLISAR